MASADPRTPTGRSAPERSAAKRSAPRPHPPATSPGPPPPRGVRPLSAPPRLTAPHFLLKYFISHALLFCFFFFAFFCCGGSGGAVGGGGGHTGRRGGRGDTAMGAAPLPPPPPQPQRDHRGRAAPHYSMPSGPQHDVPPPNARRGGGRICWVPSGQESGRRGKGGVLKTRGATAGCWGGGEVRPCPHPQCPQHIAVQEVTPGPPPSHPPPGA